jgi:hypothetical protein
MIQNTAKRVIRKTSPDFFDLENAVQRQRYISEARTTEAF